LVLVGVLVAGEVGLLSRHEMGEDFEGIPLESASGELGHLSQTVLILRRKIPEAAPVEFAEGRKDSVEVEGLKTIKKRNINKKKRLSQSTFSYIRGF